MVKIGKAEKGDLQEILDLQYFSYQSEAKLFNSTDIPPLKQTLNEVISEYEQGIILKATSSSNEIIGSVRSYEKNDTVYIGKLMVKPSMQGNGIGTKLLNAIEKQYKGKRYELFTSTKSIKNIDLYTRQGYKIFKEKKITEELTFVYLQKNNN